jgi:hypothetical protein
MGSSTCTTPIALRQKNMVMSLSVSGTKNDCAGEDQQEFIRTDGRTDGWRDVRKNCWIEDEWVDRGVDRWVSG